MTFPVQFGLPQIVLLVVALFAIVLLVTAIVEFGRVEVEDGRRTTVRLRRPRAGRTASALLLLVVAIGLLWLVALIQTFLGLTGEVKAAHVVATPVKGEDHVLNVDLTVYGNADHAQIHQTYQVAGDLWALQADIVELQHWVNVVGVHSGYKVTRLFGMRLDGKSTGQDQFLLNGGDADFFTDMHNHAWWTKPFVRSAYGNAVISPSGGYDVYISQDAIKTRPAG
jgi:hypothetical protein